MEILGTNHNSDDIISPLLGGLIGTATASKNGLVPYYAGGVLSFQYGVKVSLGSKYRYQGDNEGNRYKV